jgi:multidrug resistance efflux pump
MASKAAKKQSSSRPAGKQAERQASTRDKTAQNSGPGDAQALQEFLREEFDKTPLDPAHHPGPGQEAAENTETPMPEPAPKPAHSRIWNRITKSLVALALLIAAGWMPAQRLFQISSVEALVNARLVTLRAPIEGIVSLDPAYQRAGAPAANSAQLITISNPRADNSEITRIEGSLQDTEARRDEIEAGLSFLRQTEASLARQVADFRSFRVEQLEARVAELNAAIASAEARLEIRQAESRRFEKLYSNGYLPKADIEKSRLALRLAAEARSEAMARRLGASVELDAIRRGLFVGDSYNDQPRSMQRMDEVRVEITRLEAELASQQARIVNLEHALAAEREEFSRLNSASITSPIDGQIWEVLTASGEQVVRGQELVRVLDCASPVVTAAVSEAVYNQLSVGAPAQFTFRESTQALAGRVVQLSGIAAAPANLAITPSALTREPYRVTVSVPELGGKSGCLVGRTGRVVFGGSAKAG